MFKEKGCPENYAPHGVPGIVDYEPTDFYGILC